MQQLAYMHEEHPFIGWILEKKVRQKMMLLTIRIEWG